MGMKTSWVLTEEDKTKLQMRRESSPSAGINVGDGGLAPIHIKKVNWDIINHHLIIILVVDKLVESQSRSY